MAVNNVINLGIGSPARVDHFITLGLETNALLVGGETGYSYAPPAGSAPSLEVGPAPSGAPTYTYQA